MTVHVVDPVEGPLFLWMVDVAAASQERVQGDVHVNSEAECIVQTTLESCLNGFARMIPSQLSATARHNHQRLCPQFCGQMQGSLGVCNSGFVARTECPCEATRITDGANPHTVGRQHMQKFLLSELQHALPTNTDKPNIRTLQTLNL